MTDSPAGDGVFPSEVIIDGEVFKAPPGFEEEVEENVSAAERATPTPPSDCSAEQSTAVVISTASVPSADSSLGVGPSDQQLAVASASPAKRPRPVALASSGLMPLRQQSSAWNAATSLNNNNNASAAEAAASRDVWADLVAQTPRVERVSFDFTNQRFVLPFLPVFLSSLCFRGTPSERVDGGLRVFSARVSVGLRSGSSTAARPTGASPSASTASSRPTS